MTRSASGAPAPAGSPVPLSRREVVVFSGLILVMLLAAPGSTIVATALPTIAGELGGLDRLAWVVTAYRLAQTIVTPLYGKLGDLYAGPHPPGARAGRVVAHGRSPLVSWRSIPGGWMTPSVREIDRGLAHIRRMRRTFLSILFSFFPILVLTMHYIERADNWLPILGPAFLFLLGMLVQHRLHRQKCPRCGSYFFVQTVSKDNYTPASSISFPPQKKCQNCGLALYR